MDQNDFPMPSGGPNGSLPFGLFAPDLSDEEGSGMVEKLTISSRRSTPALLSFERTHEYNPERDALMLRAFLSTTLDSETWNFFVRDVVMNSPLSHQIMQSMMSNPQLMSMLLHQAPKPPTPTVRKPRAKRTTKKENPD